MMLSRWIEIPIVCNGRVLRPVLAVERVTDDDLADLCVRMLLIHDSIEYEVCEGRMMNLDVFNPLDRLLGEFQARKHPRLSDWIETINSFGDYYGLESRNVIEVTSRAVANTEADANQLGVFLG